MPQRYRPPMFNRRYPGQGAYNYAPAYSKNNAGGSETVENINDNSPQRVFEIPMPNEVEAENPAEAVDRPLEVHRQSFIDIIKRRIHIDDIILIGLIFLLLDDGLKDDFLLILLLYIFLF